VLTVILAGGKGERFWPLSRQDKPKQLLNLTGDGSMIRLTVERARAFSQPDELFVVTLASQRDAVAQEVGGIVPAKNIIGEPIGRNTAPSIGLAAMVLKERFGDVPFLVLPADHLVGDLDRFGAAVGSAEAFVTDHDVLLTFGITPTRPETGYGYIREGKKLGGAGGAEVSEARSFEEKPSVERAEEFVAQGSFLWNSGMFCWRTSTILDAIKAHSPDLYQILRDIEDGSGTAEFDAVLKSVYPKAPSISIDYAIMEKADNVVVVRGDFYWNDVGGWESIRDVYTSDENDNVLVGDHLVVDGAKNTVFSPDRMVGVIGLENVVVVDSDGAILICARDKVQQVREIVDILKKKGNKTLL